MKYFNLKFTPENLKRHLDYNKDYIVTVRDEPKGEYMDQVIINNKVYRLSGIIIINSRYLFTDPMAKWWEFEGFRNQEEYTDEIIRIYGDNPNQDLYIHILRLIGTVL